MNLSSDKIKSLIKVFIKYGRRHEPTAFLNRENLKYIKLKAIIC
jgi:hypothetical protein